MRIGQAGHDRATTQIDSLRGMKFFRVVIRTNEDDSPMFHGQGFGVRLVMVNSVDIPCGEENIHFFGTHNARNK
jgi:hypothetical protein